MTRLRLFEWHPPPGEGAEIHDQRDRTIHDPQDLSAPVAVGGGELPPSLAYLDRINVSFAGLRMHDDLNMPADAFGFALGTLLLGLLDFSSCRAT